MSAAPGSTPSGDASRSGFRLTVSFPLLAAAAAFALLDGSVFLAVLLAVAVHEAAHLLTLFFFGLPVLGVDCRLSGIHIRSLPGLGLAAAALAGPFAGLLVGTWTLLLVGSPPVWGMAGDVSPEPWVLFGTASLVLGLFHLLPLPGADGETLLWRLHPNTRERVTRWVWGAVFAGTAGLCAAGLCHPMVPAAVLARLGSERIRGGGTMPRHGKPDP